MSSLSDMLVFLRKRKKLSQAEVANLTGLGRSALSMYETGRREPDLETLEILADFFNVDMNTLTGRNTITPMPTVPGSRWIPILGSTAAGIPIEAIEDYPSADNLNEWEEISATMAASGEYFGLRIQGSSMEPRICSGDVVIVRKQTDANDGDIAVIIIGGAETTVKKVRKDPRGMWLIPFNPSFEPQYFSADQIHDLPVCIIGKVVELRGKF